MNARNATYVSLLFAATVGVVVSEWEATSMQAFEAMIRGERMGAEG